MKISTLVISAAVAAAASSAWAQTRFAVIGDYGVDNSTQLAVANRLKTFAPSFVTTTGDNTYFVGGTPAADFANWDRTQGKYYAEYIKLPAGSAYTANGAATNNFYPVMGNHDWDEGAQSYQDYFDLPTNPAGNERYYSFRRGDAEFFMLGSDSREPDGNTAGSAQYNWARNAIRASTAQWQIVMFHHPAYTYGSTHAAQTGMRWQFKDWGVDAVFSGHNHNMQRMTANDGVNNGLPYYVQGASGNGLYAISGQPSGATGNFSNASVNGFTIADYTADTFSVRFIDTNGNTLDTSSLTKFAPIAEPTIVTASLPAGGYGQDFNGMGTTGTAAPLGFRRFLLAGTNSTFTDATGIPAASAGGGTLITAALTATSNPTANNNNGYNAAATTGTTADRVLASAPTGDAAFALELALKNDTGAAIDGLRLGYDIRRFSAPATVNELPGYQLFYSLDNGTSWINASAFNPVATGANGIVVPNTVGVTTVTPTNLRFGRTIAAGENVLLRWIDDNATQTSPDQIIGLDNLSILGTVADRNYANFRQGINAYAGTSDTRLAQATPDTNFANDTGISVDSDDPNGTGSDAQALIRFDDIIGTGPGQVAPGTTVLSARIELTIFDAGSGFTVREMLLPWLENTATWNSFGNGVQADGIEAGLDTIASFVDVTTGRLVIDITATVQKWANGTLANNGLAFFPIPTGNNGVDFRTSEYSVVSERPVLIIESAIPEPSALGLMVPAGVMALRRRRRA